jgi:hypothetical protein
VEFRRRSFTYVRLLQAALERYLEFNNHRRPHPGYRTRGLLPAELFWGRREGETHDRGAEM